MRTSSLAIAGNDFCLAVDAVNDSQCFDLPAERSSWLATARAVVHVTIKTHALLEVRDDLRVAAGELFAHIARVTMIDTLAKRGADATVLLLQATRTAQTCLQGSFAIARPSTSRSCVSSQQTVAKEKRELHRVPIRPTCPSPLRTTRVSSMRSPSRISIDDDEKVQFFAVTGAPERCRTRLSDGEFPGCVQVRRD